jgi:hypothetical protein
VYLAQARQAKGVILSKPGFASENEEGEPALRVDGENSPCFPQFGIAVSLQASHTGLQALKYAVRPSKAVLAWVFAAPSRFRQVRPDVQVIMAPAMKGLSPGLRYC